MRRHGFKMKLKHGQAAEYKKRHDQIWPELLVLLRAHGVRDYHIYHDEETDILFAVQHQTADATPDELPTDPLMRKWFDHMSDIMETDETGAPIMTPIVEVFHMD